MTHGERVGGAGDGGRFGRWVVDGDGQPAFDFSPGEASLIVPKGGAARCWHSVSNAGITALAHADGTTTIYATARGMTRLTGAGSTWGMAGADVVTPQVRFGLGYAEWTTRSGDTEVVRRLSVPASGEPVLRVDLRITGDDPRPFVDRWAIDARPLLVGALMSSNEPPPPGYGVVEQAAWRGLYGLSSVVRAATNAARLALGPMVLHAPTLDPNGRAVVARARRRAADVAVDEPAWFDRSLPDLVCLTVHGPVRVGADSDAGAVLISTGGGPHDVIASYAIGLARTPSDVDRLRDLARDSTSFRARLWGGFATLSSTRDPVLEREATWHAAQLVAAEQHDDHFGARYIAQGSAYGFIHGLQGAPRDYALYAVPMAYLDPAAAREQLIVMMRMTRPSGTTYYAHTGRGQCTSGGLHAAPTDLPLFFMWALTEYVWTTGDAAFLDEPVPFWPATAGRTATPRERLAIAVAYMADRVGVGPHGMLRVGSGDWSDPISAMVADRKAFHEHGESGFNSAFAAYVLPRVASVLRDSHEGAAAVADALAEQVRDAMAATWTGRWFLRGWDGRGAPIGEDHLFLDGQVWALIGQLGTDEQRATLVAQIAERCDDPSPIGATILDRPHDVRLGMLAPGWDCNGGVWATINALLAWGYARHDPARAVQSMHKQSLAAHAAAYPDIWYGIWSGPDAYNAHFGSRPGETFVQPATPMREFPVMNANAHAGPLLALLRVLGIETGPGGITVRDGGELGAWRLQTPLGTFTPEGFTAAT